MGENSHEKQDVPLEGRVTDIATAMEDLGREYPELTAYLLERIEALRLLTATKDTSESGVEKWVSQMEKILARHAGQRENSRESKVTAARVYHIRETLAQCEASITQKKEYLAKLVKQIPQKELKELMRLRKTMPEDLKEYHMSSWPYGTKLDRAL